MKYKIGDIVKIKTWEKMEKEFGLGEWGNISYKGCSFTRKREEIFNEVSPDRIVKISRVNQKYKFYEVDSFHPDWHWTNNMIEEIVERAKSDSSEIIISRFEILDL